MNIFLDRGTVKYTHNQKGQALVLIVLGIVGMIALVALAIDGGNAFMNRRHAQAAADAAAMAAALAKINNQDWNASGLARAASNDFNNDGIHNTVTVVNPPGTGCNGVVGPYAGNNEYIQVIINSSIDTFFAQIVGVTQTSSCVESISRAKPSETTPIVFGNGMVSLNPHACKAFWVHGTADTTVIGSGVFVNSDCASGAFQAFNQSGNATIAAPGICVVGGATYSAGDVSPVPQTGCGTQLPYPPEYVWPQPSCSVDGTNSGGILTPGNVPGSWIDGNVTLQPGIYCISGDVKINANSNLRGTEVLLYFVNGGLSINGGAQVDLSSQTSAPYAGLLIYLPITNTSTVILNGNGNSKFTGTILAPASEIQVNGTSSNYGYHSQIVGYTIDLSGTAGTSIIYNDSENFDITLPPTIELVR
jgi:hypothetical protein